MAYTWMKLHCKTLDNPAIGFLSDTLWRRYIELMLIAKEYDRGDELPPVPDIAWRLRMSPDACNETLQQLETVKLVKKCVTQNVTNSNETCNDTLQLWHLTGFEESQQAESGAKRISDWRERQKSGQKPTEKQQKPSKNDEAVTKRYTDMKTYMMHDDDVNKNNDLLRENLAILELDMQGVKGIPTEIITRWAADVENIPAEWGPGLIVMKMRAGELPPEPQAEPEPAFENPVELPQRAAPDAAQVLWKQIRDTHNVYNNAFNGSNAVGFDNGVLTISVPESKIDWLTKRLNGQLARTAQSFTGSPVEIVYEVK